MQFPELKFLNSQKAGMPSIALDIGTDAIKAFVYEKTNGRITLLGKSVQYIDPFRAWAPPISKSNVSFDLKVILECANRAVEEAQKIAQKKASQIFLCISPSILRAHVSVLTIERLNRSRRISKKEENEILQKARKEGEAAASKCAAKKYGLESGDMLFASFKIIGINIDGYGVNSLRNFNGKNIEIRYLITFLLKNFTVQAAYSAVAQEFENFFGGSKKLKSIFHEAEYFKNPTPLFREGVFIDIGGRVTTVFVFKDAFLAHMFEFSAGCDDFLNKLEEDMPVDKMRARAMMEQYCQGDFSGEVSAEIAEKVAPIVSDWFFELKGGLSEVAGFLPGSFYLLGGGALIPDIKNAIENGDWRKISVAGVPIVTLLFPKDLSGIEDPGNIAKSPQDTPTLLMCYQRA